jgi:hypothetical protein
MAKLKREQITPCYTPRLVSGAERPESGRTAYPARRQLKIRKSRSITTKSASASTLNLVRDEGLSALNRAQMFASYNHRFCKRQARQR